MEYDKDYISRHRQVPNMGRTWNLDDSCRPGDGRYGLFDTICYPYPIPDGILKKKLATHFDHPNLNSNLYFLKSFRTEYLVCNR